MKQLSSVMYYYPTLAFYKKKTKYANHKKFSKHSPAGPLYTFTDAKNLSLFVPNDYDEETEVLPQIIINFSANGHILGSSSVALTAQNKTLVFSGDVGKQNDLVMYAPKPIASCDLLVVEAT